MLICNILDALGCFPTWQPNPPGWKIESSFWLGLTLSRKENNYYEHKHPQHQRFEHPRLDQRRSCRLLLLVYPGCHDDEKEQEAEDRRSSGLIVR